MDASPLLREPTPAPAPPVAIVAGERMLFASAQLADLTGYTLNELTSPEFRFSYLFTAEAPLLVGFSAGETRRVQAKVVPLRGEPRRVTVTLKLLSQVPEDSFLVILEPAELPTGEPEASARAARSLVQGLRASLAREAGALRKLQERVAGLELSTTEALARQLAPYALMHEELSRLEVARVRLERHVAALTGR